MAYAQDTQHEKILRGLAVGIALVMYGRLEEADTLIESMCNDKVLLVVVFTKNKDAHSNILIIIEYSACLF